MRQHQQEAIPCGFVTFILKFEGGGNLTFTLLALAMALAIPLSSHAQKSSPTPCTVGPCMRVGVMADGGYNSATFASDQEHFIYCGEGDAVLVDVLATFLDGTACDDCEHGTRSWTWEVEGATSYSIVSEIFTSSKRSATFLLSEAGDSVTITAKVSAVTEGSCDEDRHGNVGEHGGSHAGAQAACTIKLWRMDMKVAAAHDDPEEDPEPVDPTAPGGDTYETVFAKSITTSAVLVGAAPADVPNWEWESVVDSPDIYATESGATSWGGEMVASTSILLSAIALNGCDATHTAPAIGHVVINPTIRRPGWKMENVSASPGTDMNWLSGDENAFPGMEPDTPLGLNSNAVTKYRDLPAQVVTPIYVDLSITNPGDFPPEDWPNGVPNDTGNFTGKVKEIENGPNIDFFYNSGTSIFEVNRIALLNHWITPQGTWPSIVPNVNPNNGNPASYNRWLELYTAGQQNCQCSDPGGHGASGVSNIRHISNSWHEGAGCPDSANREKLGHQIRIKKAIEGTQPQKYDVLWRCDLIYAESEAALRILDEVERSDTSAELLTVSGGLHTFLSADPQKHNFYGFFWSYDSTSGWTQPMQNY